MELDLRPYGLNLTLTPHTDLMALGLDIMAPATRYRPHYFSGYKGFVVGGIPYIAKKKLGGGAFGDVYKVEHENTLYACKINKDMKTSNDFYAFLCETLIHILLLQTSVGELNGPYVPYLYKVGYDKSVGKTYLITEWLSHTLDDDILHHSKAENDRRLPTVLAQVAHALTLFGFRLKFNHRDLHPNNIMIAGLLNGSLNRVVLIDFGYSCLSWKGLEIRGPSLYNDVPHPCYKPDRDMPFLCMRLYKTYKHHLSHSLLETIHSTIRGSVGGKQCDMGEFCPEHGLKELMGQYEFLDRPNVRVPLGATDRTERLFRTLRVPTHATRKQTFRGARTQKALPFASFASFSSVVPFASSPTRKRKATRRISRNLPANKAIRSFREPSL
jgi:serine/threonine protein kinase